MTAPFVVFFMPIRTVIIFVLFYNNLIHILEYYSDGRSKLTEMVQVTGVEFTMSRARLRYKGEYLMSGICSKPTLIARFMEPTLGPSRADSAQVGPMLAP